MTRRCWHSSLRMVLPSTRKIKQGALLFIGQWSVALGWWRGGGYRVSVGDSCVWSGVCVRCVRACGVCVRGLCLCVCMCWWNWNCGANLYLNPRVVWERNAVQFNSIQSAANACMPSSLWCPGNELCLDGGISPSDGSGRACSRQAAKHGMVLLFPLYQPTPPSNQNTAR
jgi:hypothetical protein